MHPYRWPTIGKRVEHIEQVKLEDVKSFFYKHYAPNNAILAVTGNISFEEAVELTEKWFGTIERRDIEPRNLPAEPVQKSARFQEVSRSVPLDSIVIRHTIQWTIFPVVSTACYGSETVCRYRCQYYR